MNATDDGYDTSDYCKACGGDVDTCTCALDPDA